jgi:Cu+-exporting ATPase
MNLVQDPVCGKALDAGRFTVQHIHNRETYHFCSRQCKDKFVANPEGFVGSWKSAAARRAPAGGGPETA